MDAIPTETAGERCECGYLLRGVQAERCPECGRNVSSLGEIPIASYCERRLELRRDFTLYTDKIMVRNKRLSGTGYWIPIHLDSLSPNTTTIWTRSKLLNTSSLFLLLGIPLFYVGHEYPKLVSSDTIFVAGFALSLIGLVLLIATIQVVEFVRFHAKDRPEVVLLDVGRVGPQVAKFNDFIAAARAAIKARQCK